jgi:hypothetical protein
MADRMFRNGAIALFVKLTMASPAGNAKPFWLSATATSTPYLSKRKSIDAIELTPSTNNKAG